SAAPKSPSRSEEHPMRRPARPRRGTVVAWLAICLPVLVGVLALCVDAGRMLDERRRAQAVADAAALAAAVKLYENAKQGQWFAVQAARDAALAMAASNGYANDGTESVVTVNSPPTSGAFAGKSGYVEVLTRYNLPGTFSALLNRGAAMPIGARTVARGTVEK